MLKTAAEPLCVAYKALVSNSRVSPGDMIVIIGPGAIGILCAKLAQPWDVREKCLALMGKGLVDLEKLIPHELGID